VNQADGVRTEENCYHQEFGATLNFDADGSFTQVLNGEEFTGKWKLSKHRTSFTLKYNNGTKINIKAGKNEKLNFEEPLRIPEFFPSLYTTEGENLFGGTSSYMRLEDSRYMEFMKKMVGTWTTCASETFDTSLNCDVDNHVVTYYFKEDGTFTSDHEYTASGNKYSMLGRWKMIDDNSLILIRASEHGLVYTPFQIDLCWIEDTLAYTIRIEGLNPGTKVYYYFKKVE